MDDAQINLKDYTLLKKIGAGVSGEAFCMNLSSGLFEHIHIYNIKMIKICEYAFFNCCRLRKVEIPTNSNLQTIEKYAFSGSNIEEIYFPKSLIELKEGWCSDTRELIRIIISPSNGQFIFKEDKYLICKSNENNENNEEFDKLVFVRRDIKEISIPRNIKIIGSYSFERSNIEEISIPASVTKICENAFSKFIKYYIFIQKFSFKSFFYFKNRAF